MLAVRHFRANRVVATVVDSVHGMWDGAVEDGQMHPGKFKLIRGFAQIRFRKGAEVIIQAPCEFELQSPSKMYLSSGMVTARIPEHAIGFTIETASSRIVDFGTEFGVSVDSSNQSEVHVFDGHVRLRSSTGLTAGRLEKELKRGQIATTDRTGTMKIARIGDRPNLFVRKLPSKLLPGIPGQRLDLADVVGGGTGFGVGRLNQGIDLLTGRTIPYPIVKSGLGTGRYINMPSLPFIDGVFVPDGGQGHVKISSTGLVFEDCPDTTGGYWLGVFNGATMMISSGQICHGMLAGRVHGTPDSPAINLHANAGVTFDLDAIRAAMPGIKILRFKSLCGISQTSEDPEITAGFWVLVDGRVRYSAMDICQMSGPIDVEVPLNDQDRFLTLTATDNGFSNNWAWSFFAGPVLELRPVNHRPDRENPVKPATNAVLGPQKRRY